MTYRVCGTVTYNWEQTVEAESDAEAEQLAIGYADDGRAEINGTIEKPEVNSVEKCRAALEAANQTP